MLTYGTDQFRSPNLTLAVAISQNFTHTKIIHCIVHDPPQFIIIISTEPPESPSAPTAPRATTITATTFFASWTAPTFNGRLALRNYTIETKREGSDICPSDSGYIVAQEGVSSEVTSATVQSLKPYSTYTFRVIAFNSVYRSEPSVASAQFITPQAGQENFNYCKRITW